MRTQAYALVFAASATVLAACSSVAASVPSTTATPAAAPVAASNSGAYSSGNGAATPTLNPSKRVSGTVKEMTVSTITLADGTVFSTSTSTRVTRLETITPADLKAGQYVAVTAQRQPDNTLLASIVNVFDESMRGLGPGQRPMTGGNLMTNATIDNVSGNTFTVSWDGGGANIKLAPDAKVNRIVIGKLDDIKVGDSISASVANDTAQSISK